MYLLYNMDNTEIPMTMTKLASVPAPMADLSSPSTATTAANSLLSSNIKVVMEPPFKNTVIKQPVIDFTALKGFQEKEKIFKADIKRKLIVENIKNVLAIYEADEKKYNAGIVLFVCQCVEDLIHKPKLGALKADIVKEICADFFDGKPELVEMVIDLIFDKIIKTNFWRRHSLKIRNMTYNVSKNVLQLMVGSVSIKF